MTGVARCPSCGRTLELYQDALQRTVAKCGVCGHREVVAIDRGGETFTGACPTCGRGHSVTVPVAKRPPACKRCGEPVTYRGRGRPPVRCDACDPAAAAGRARSHGDAPMERAS